MCTRVRETLSPVCRTVCAGVGTHFYVGQYVQLWGNTCMKDSMYRCEGNTCNLYVGHYAQVWGNTCM